MELSPQERALVEKHRQTQAAAAHAELTALSDGERYTATLKKKPADWTPADKDFMRTEIIKWCSQNGY